MSLLRIRPAIAGFTLVPLVGTSAMAASMQEVTPTPKIDFDQADDNALIGDRSEWVVTGDLDGTNGPDVAVSSVELSQDGDEERVEIFLTESDGSLIGAQTFVLGTDVGLAAIVLADLDGDLDNDLAVSLSNSATVQVLLNTGSGSFVVGDEFDTQGRDQDHMAGGDVDADGDIDLVTSNHGSNNLSVLYNEGDARFGAPAMVPVGPEPAHLAIEDFNGDCDLDIAVVLQGNAEVVVLRNQGGGFFLQAAIPTSASGAELQVELSGITAADLDVDGDVDLAVTSRVGHDLDACVLMNDGSAGFTVDCFDTDTGVIGSTPPVLVDEEQTVEDAILSADLNGDGNKDLALTDSITSYVRALHGVGATGFLEPVSVRVGSEPTMIASGDFDGNGSIDLVTSNRMWGSVSKLINTSQGGTHSFCMIRPNSVGAGARLDTTGSVSITSDEFTLAVRCAPTGQNGLFFYGPGKALLAFGDGLRCVGAPLFRLPPPLAIDADGVARRNVHFDEPPAGGGAGRIVAGSTWYFQFWYRDVADARDADRADMEAWAAVYNLTDGLSATFRP